MLYFNTLPKILTPDENGRNILLTNLMVRASILQELQNNPMIFYEYTIQDGDTPEIVAEKYYGDSYDYWIILYSNQLLDPQWDWPLSRNEFNEYINSKYLTDAEAEDKTPFEYTNTTIQKYEKIITTTDLTTDESNVIYISLTESDYNSLIPSTQSYVLPNGTGTVVSVEKRAVTIYDYEMQTNEKKREIKIMNEIYLASMHQQLTDLMRA